MNTATSTSFISTAATGENWRDISKKVLEQLEALKTEGFKPNIGFIYITDALIADAGSILSLFQLVTGVSMWSGCSAMGVCSGGEEFVGVPAISAMIGSVPPDQVRSFSSAPGSNFKQLHQDLEPWLNKHDPMLVFLHADPLVGAHPAQAIEEIESLVGGFMVGGLCSSRERRVVFAHNVIEGGCGGFIFSADIPVATTVSQGCVPMGPMHEISKADNHVIAYLDGKQPFEVFSEDLKKMAEARLGFKPAEALLKNDNANLLQNISAFLEGQAHIAFPVSGTDQKDFLVRNIMAIDPDSGMIAVGENLEEGQKVMFVHRSDETVRADLSASLVALRERVTHDTGDFAPKAALYVSCVARASVAFAGDGSPGGEMALLKDVLGDIPITGFYAGGEISNNRLYGYTGVLTLFL